jgi:hypothetical protein
MSTTTQSQQSQSQSQPQHPSSKAKDAPAPKASTSSPGDKETQKAVEEAQSTNPGNLSASTTRIAGADSNVTVTPAPGAKAKALASSAGSDDDPDYHNKDQSLTKVYINGTLVEVPIGSISAKDLKQAAIDGGDSSVKIDHKLREEVHGQKAKQLSDDDDIEIVRSSWPQRFVAVEDPAGAGPGTNTAGTEPTKSGKSQ